jgi:hypothetical protein
MFSKVKLLWSLFHFSLIVNLVTKLMAPVVRSEPNGPEVLHTHNNITEFNPKRNER